MHTVSDAWQARALLDQENAMFAYGTADVREPAAKRACAAPVIAASAALEKLGQCLQRIPQASVSSAVAIEFLPAAAGAADVSCCYRITLQSDAVVALGEAPARGGYRDLEQ